MRRFLLFTATALLWSVILMAGMSYPIAVAQPTATFTPTPTSQPAPPILLYPPNGVIINRHLTIQDLSYTTTGFMTYVTVTGDDFTAQYCEALHGECQPYQFENETVLLPNGYYEWQVYTTKPMGSAISEKWRFQIAVYPLPPYHNHTME